MSGLSLLESRLSLSVLQYQSDDNLADCMTLPVCIQWIGVVCETVGTLSQLALRHPPVGLHHPLPQLIVDAVYVVLLLLFISIVV
jgi:hypothetical protein